MSSLIFYIEFLPSSRLCDTITELLKLECDAQSQRNKMNGCIILIRDKFQREREKTEKILMHRKY